LKIVPELVRPVHPLNDFIALRKLEKLLREQKPDIVHTHSGKAGILGRLAARRAKVPIIIHHIHVHPSETFKAHWPTGFHRRGKTRGEGDRSFLLLRRGHDEALSRRRHRRPEMYTRIFSGFKLEPFLDATNDLALRQRLGLDAGHFVIWQDWAHLQAERSRRSRNGLCQNSPGSSTRPASFCGRRLVTRRIVNQILSLGLTGKVIFTGLVPPGEVARHVGIMDCLAHLSYREALSRALPQALAAGKPVVAYDFDGADEICLENETSFLVRTGDTDTAAKRLLQLAQNPRCAKNSAVMAKFLCGKILHRKRWWMTSIMFT